MSCTPPHIAPTISWGDGTFCVQMGAAVTVFWGTQEGALGCWQYPRGSIILPLPTTSYWSSCASVPSLKSDQSMVSATYCFPTGCTIWTSGSLTGFHQGTMWGYDWETPNLGGMPAPRKKDSKPTTKEHLLNMTVWTNGKDLPQR